MSERKRKRKFGRFPRYVGVQMENDLFRFVKQFANREGLLISGAVRKLLRIAKKTIENEKGV